MSHSAFSGAAANAALSLSLFAVWQGISPGAQDQTCGRVPGLLPEIQPRKIRPESAAVLLAASSARAFVREFDHAIPMEWTKDRTVLMHLSLPTTGGPFIDGSPTLNDVAENALKTWNQYLVHLQFAANKQSIVPPSDTDANTSVTMSRTIYGDTFAPGVLAVTLVTPRNG